MKLFLKIAAFFLLLFNGTGALYGGWNLITHPDGSSIQLSMDWLQYTPFTDYLIPGIILFIMNGILSYVALIMLLVNAKRYPWYILGEGVILLGWLIIQMILIRTVYFLHLVLGAVGILLIISGFLLKRRELQESSGQ